MKPLMFAAALLAPMVVQAPAFEGTIAGVMTAEGRQVETEQLIRGSMRRHNMNMAGNSVSIITDGESGKTLLLNHAQKMWMDMAAMNQMMGRMGRGARQRTETPQEMPPIERTDRVETVAGHQCRHYIVNSPNGKVDLCAASGMGVVLPGGSSPMGGMGRNQGPSLPELPNASVWKRAFSDGFFVLRMEAATAQGTVSWVAKSVERKAVSEDEFRPPAGYSEMKLPGGR